MPIDEYEELKNSISLKNRIEELTVENNNLRGELIIVKENLQNEKRLQEMFRDECKILRMGAEVFKDYEFIFKRGNFFKKIKVLFSIH